MYSFSSVLPAVWASRLVSAFPWVVAFILSAMAIFFGGVMPFTQALLPILCAILLALSTTFPAPTPLKRENRHIVKAIAIPVIVTLVIGLIQLLPLTNTHIINLFWSITPQKASWTPITMNPGQSMAQLALAAGYAAFAAAVFRAGRAGFAPRLLKVTAVLVTALSFYGLFIYATGNKSVLWLPKTSYTDSLTSTFINRNSFATFAGLGILACMAVTLQRVGEITSRLSNRQRFEAFWLLVLKPNWPWLCAAAICLLALALTNSRAGLLASLSGLMVLLGALAGMRTPARWPLIGMITTLFIVALIFLSAVGERVATRLQTVQVDSAIRTDIYALTQDVISQYPFTGTGLGTYQQALATSANPAFLSGMPYVIEHAHNTYLEVASELGYPAMALLGLSLLLTLTSYINGLINRRRAIIWPALGCATMVLVGGHALVDFSLSIPAVTLVTLTLMALALSQSFLNRDADAPTLKPTTLRKMALPAILVFSVVLFGAGGWQSLAAWFSFRAEATTAILNTGKPLPLEQIQTAQSKLETCLAINPYHPTCALDLAQTNLSIATLYGFTGPKKGMALVYMFVARDQYQAALTHGPVNPHAWYRLARLEAYGEDTPTAITALANSLLTGPAEPSLAVKRLPFILSLMKDTDPENRALFRKNVLSIWEAQPWTVAQELRNNKVVQPQFAALLGDSPETRGRWQHVIGTPFPAPLGE